jgi:hypothetical protein
MFPNFTPAILGEVKKALASPLSADDIAKTGGWQQSASSITGITQYALDVPALSLFPVIYPLVQKIPRITGGQGIQANWRAVTGINTANLRPGVPAGTRNTTVTHTTSDYLAAFKTMSLDESVDFQADWAAEGFDDIKARAVTNLLWALMIQEEQVDLWGNTSLAMNGTYTPTLTQADTGGTLLDSTNYVVKCVPLTLAGYQQVAGTNNGMIGSALNAATATISSTFTITPANGAASFTRNGGVGKPGTATVATSANGGNKHSIAASVTVVPGAAAYAWYVGTAGSEKLNSISTLNSVVITTPSDAGAQAFTALSANDCSEDQYEYDGLVTQIFKGGYYDSLATGTPGTGNKLTADGGGGITEINTVFLNMYNLYRLSPTEIFVNAQQAIDINALVIKGGAAPLARFNIDANAPGTIVGGAIVGTLMNKITGTQVKITVHPNVPPGTMVFWSDRVPYPVNNAGQLIRKRLRRDYFATEWPITTFQYTYASTMDGVLQCLAPFAFRVLNNIAPGV